MPIPKTMHAMVLEKPGTPLKYLEVPVPAPGPEQVLIRVHACGVCRTDLHIVDGELTEPKLPLIIGHEIVGTVAAVGAQVQKFRIGDRIGVPWLGYTCGQCRYCRRGRENLCETPKFTGYTLDGGYAEYTVADQRYTFPSAGGLPRRPGCAPALRRAHRLPLLPPGRRGRGAPGDLRFRGRGPHHRPGGGASGPEGLRLHPPGRHRDPGIRPPPGGGLGRRLRPTPPGRTGRGHHLRPGGSAGPRGASGHLQGRRRGLRRHPHERHPLFPLRLLWGERVVRSVANLTRRDGEEFLALAPKVPIKTEIQTFPLEQANDALNRLRAGQITGAAVLVIG